MRSAAAPGAFKPALYYRQMIVETTNVGLKSLFGKLTGSSGQTDSGGNETEYKGYLIRPAPMQQGGQYLTAGVIKKTFADGVKEQRFVRADTHASRDDACAHAISKAQRIIDEQGDKLFRDA